MKFSVVLCTYNQSRYDHFLEAAESILQQTYDDVELVVVVDGSGSLSKLITRDMGGRHDVVIRSNDENVGLLESRNRGAETASGDIIAFIDDDAIAEKDWISELASTFDQYDAQAAGGRMDAIWVNGKPRFLPEEYYWLIGVTHRGFSGSAGVVRNTFGSNISFRKDVFDDLGGFDTDIGGRKGDKNLQGGETELCARLRDEYGEGVFYNPDAVVNHKVFSYRTRPMWLIDRAFWQGYSKRAMKSIISGAEDEEHKFLYHLLFEFGPARLKSLITRPSVTKLQQYCTLWILTAVVGAGYLYGATHW